MEYQEELGKVIMEKNGQGVECDVLFTFDCEELGKTYIGFTDHSIADNGRKNIYVKSWDPVLGQQLEDITDPDEVKMVGDVLNQIEQDVNNPKSVQGGERK